MIGACWRMAHRPRLTWLPRDALDRFDPAPMGNTAVGISISWRVTVFSTRLFSLGARFPLYWVADTVWPSCYCHGRPESGFPRFLLCRSMPPHLHHGRFSVPCAVYNEHDARFYSFSLTTQRPRHF